MRPRRRTAFTMIELIIIIVVLGLLAGIGIVAYGQIVTSSQDRAAAASLTDVAREAAALAAQNGETEWSQADFTTALADTAAGPALGGSGVSAAGRLALVNAAADSTNSSSMSYGQVSLQTRAGGVAGLAMRTQSGNCVFVRAVLPQQISTWRSAGDLGGNCLASVGLDGGPGGSYTYTAQVASGSTPLAPSGLTAALSGAAVNLSWSTVPGATAGYAVYRSADGGATWTSLTAGLTSPAYADAAASTPGTTYSYAVTASAANESPKSAPAQVTLAPAAPTGVQAAPYVTTGSQTATISWTAVPGAVSYTLTTSPAGGQPTTTSTSTTSATVPTPATDTAYTFTVTATNAGGTGPASAPVGFTTTGVPATPTGVRALNDHTGAVQVFWHPTTDATSFTVQRSTDKTNWVTFYTGASGWYTGTDGQQWLSAIDTGVTNGTTYYYRVTGLNAYGTGAPSVVDIYSAAQPSATTYPAGHFDGVKALGGNVIEVAGWGVSPDFAARGGRYIDVTIGKNVGNTWERTYNFTVDGAGSPVDAATGARADVVSSLPGYGPATGYDVKIGGIVAGTWNVCVTVAYSASQAGTAQCLNVTATN